MNLRWLNKTLSIAACAQLIFAPLSRAAAPSYQQISNGVLLSSPDSRFQAGSQGPNYSGSQYKVNLYSFTADDKKVAVGEIDLNPDSEGTGEQFSPDQLNALIAKLQAEARKKAFGDTSLKGNFIRSVQSMPNLALAFYVGMGALAQWQLATDYAKDPLGSVHNLEGQVSPVGLLGLYLFSVTQGYTLPRFDALMKSPKLKRLVPYQAMGAGLFVQSYVSKLISDPNVLGCYSELLKAPAKKESNSDSSQPSSLVPEQTETSCHKAWNYYVTQKRLLDVCPDLISMIGATMASAYFGEKIALKAARFGKKAKMNGRLAVATGQVFAEWAEEKAPTVMKAANYVKVKGIDLALLIAPGTGELKFLRWMVRIGEESGQIVLFTAAQKALGAAMDYTWKNTFVASRFNRLNDALVQNIESEKRAGWPVKAGGIEDTVNDFASSMKQWRMDNMKETFESYESWSELLENLIGVNVAAKQVYGLVIDQINSGDKSLLNRSYPYVGIGGLAAGHENEYFTNAPRTQENVQVDTVAGAAPLITKALQDKTYQNDGMSQDQINKLTSLRNLLQSQDANVQSRAIQEMNAFVATSPVTPFTSPVIAEYHRILTFLGNPEPMPEPGRGYFATMEKAPMMTDIFKNLKFPNQVGNFMTPTITDYLIMQMICGPQLDRGGQTIQARYGYRMTFVPPALTVETPERVTLCTPHPGKPYSREQIFAFPNSKYKSALDYLQKNLQPEVKRDFNGWWQKKVVPQFTGVYEKLSKEYTEIIVSLAKDLNRKTELLNVSYVSNGVLDSMTQESRVYLMILGELLKDDYHQQHGRDMPDQPNYRFHNGPVPVALGPESPLLALLLKGPYFDFNHIVKDPRGPEYSLSALKVIDDRIQAMRQAAQPISCSQNSCQLNPNLMHLKDRLGDVQVAINAAATYLGFNNDPKLQSYKLVTLSKEQRALAVTCINSLQNVTREMVLFGTITNLLNLSAAQSAGSEDSPGQ